MIINKNLIETSNENQFTPVKMPKTKISKIDATNKWTIVLIASIVLVLLAIIIAFIIYKSVNIFQEYGFLKFIFGTVWDPSSNEYGIFKTILSTIMMLIMALLFAVPLTLFSSLFITEYLKGRMKKLVVNSIHLLAGIPSVVFGLFAINQIGPIFKAMGAASASNMMTASVTLAFMSLPTMISLSISGISSVPDGYRFASLGLGLTKEHTTFSIIRKAATSKVVSAIIMGMARIIGETMAVILIAGNSTSGLDTSHGFMDFFFSSIRTLAGTIGLEMLENRSQTHESALYAIGLVLFFIVILINLVILLLSKQKKQKIKGKTKKLFVKHEYDNYDLTVIVKTHAQRRGMKELESSLALFFMISSTLIVIAFTFWVLLVVILKGLIGFAFANFISIEGQSSGIFATMITTFLLIASTAVIAIPVSLIVSIFLWGYSNPKSWFTKTIRFAISVLSSTPSIVYGVFGLTVFIILMKLPMSIFASSLTMTLVIIPTLVTSFEDALDGVPSSYVEASVGLGMSKTRTIWLIVVPSAMRDLVTGVILAIARIIGESAPVYLTLGTAVRMPVEGFLASGATLATEIYMLASEGSSTETLNLAYMMSMITIVIVVLLNWLSHSLSIRLNPLYHKQSFKQKWSYRIKKINEFSLKKWFIKIGTSIKSRFKILWDKISPQAIKLHNAKIKKENRVLKEIYRKNKRGEQYHDN
ncbi:phosphate ABC transporter permease PstA [Spiroplasma endosymbiont of Labia minor]|uniref:phosphate ABC transporter permease PstA n=1 Tax=Spiroplasma endosymbiont of Labia minor TaxID=3066305 RepID=UPI0030D35676